MFLCQPLLDVLIARGVEDIDSFIELPSWNDLLDPESIPGITDAVDRVLAAVRDKQRIAIFGDYDCDGILGTHICVRFWPVSEFRRERTCRTGTKDMVSAPAQSTNSPFVARTC